MIREDYISLMIQQISALIARILNQTLSHESMNKELDSLTGQWIGLPVEVLLSLPKEHVFSLFEDSERMVIEKSYLMAEILRAKGIASDSADAKREYFESATFFYQKCSGTVDQPIQREIEDRLSELNEALDGG